MKTDEAKRRALVELAEREESEVCLAAHAIAVLDELGFDDEDVFDQGARFKLAGRPSGRVREFAKYAASKRPEQRQHLLMMFAKRVGVVGG